MFLKRSFGDFLRLRAQLDLAAIELDQALRSVGNAHGVPLLHHIKDALSRGPLQERQLRHILTQLLGSPFHFIHVRDHRSDSG